MEGKGAWETVVAVKSFCPCWALVFSVTRTQDIISSDIRTHQLVTKQLPGDCLA